MPHSVLTEPSVATPPIIENRAPRPSFLERVLRSLPQAFAVGASDDPSGQLLKLIETRRQAIEERAKEEREAERRRREREAEQAHETDITKTREAGATERTKTTVEAADKRSEREIGAADKRLDKQLTREADIKAKDRDFTRELRGVDLANEKELVSLRAKVQENIAEIQHEGRMEVARMGAGQNRDVFIAKTALSLAAAKVDGATAQRIAEKVANGEPLTPEETAALNRAQAVSETDISELLATVAKEAVRDADTVPVLDEKGNIKTDVTTNKTVMRPATDEEFRSHVQARVDAVRAVLTGNAPAPAPPPAANPASRTVDRQVAAGIELINAARASGMNDADILAQIEEAPLEPAVKQALRQRVMTLAPAHGAQMDLERGTQF